VLHVAEQVVKDLTLLNKQQELKGFAFLFLEKGSNYLSEVTAKDGF